MRIVFKETPRFSSQKKNEDEGKSKIKFLNPHISVKRMETTDEIRAEKDLRLKP